MQMCLIWICGFRLVQVLNLILHSENMFGLSVDKRLFLQYNMHRTNVPNRCPGVSEREDEGNAEQKKFWNNG